MEGQGTSPRRRLALLIDAENIHDAGLVRRLLDLLGRHGEVRIRRVYGDWSGERLHRWREALVQYAIQAVQVFPVAAGKNAADIALVVDAMDLLHGGDVDGFCLLASDSDYTRLAPLLREVLTGKGWQVLSAVGQALRKLEPGFDVKHYGHAQLQKLLRAHPQLVECRPASGTVQHVRLRP